VTPGRALALMVALSACAAEPPVARPLTEVTIPAGFPAADFAATAPPENALTETRARLGRRLFFDRRLSRDSIVACATCHHPEAAFAESSAVSTGVGGRRGSRNAPALVNLAWTTALFWDGRVISLEEQTGKPIEHPDEMDLPLAEAVRRLDADPTYGALFAEAYGGPPTELTLRRALASFVRTLVSGDSPYDRFLRGDSNALSAPARRGLDLFLAEKTGCFHCHPGGALTNDGFFNNGTFVTGADPGRQQLTGRPGDLGKFRVPGLRNVAVTAPYMHDGSVPTLEAVVEQYARGGRGDPATDSSITPLSLTAEERADLVAFLRALTDEDFLRDPRYRN
jgi:cytochrome c peroxidase